MRVDFRSITFYEGWHSYFPNPSTAALLGYTLELHGWTAVLITAAKMIHLMGH